MRHLRPSDLRAAAQLATAATQGVVQITEGVHQSVRRRLGLSSGATPEHTGGLTGQIYRVVRTLTAWVGQGTDATLALLLPLLDTNDAEHPATPEREAVLAALNGVLGDRLEAMGNPLAQRMELRLDGVALPERARDLRTRLAGAGTSPHLVLLIHGLCMNDTQWRRAGHDHGDFLAQALGATPIYLRYNSGRHISTNGRELADQLERLAAAWPVPLQRISLIGHSMGGLVARSAVAWAQQAAQRWPGRLSDLVCLGTPHHGAPLERAGHGVDALLAATPHTAPFARLGQLRSAGITDLRHGHVMDADWQGHDRFGDGADHRQPLPLPEGVRCCAVAATLAGPRAGRAAAAVGDGLVPVDSALGRHADPALALHFAPERCLTVPRTGHLDLLSSPVVAARVREWLAGA